MGKFKDDLIKGKEMEVKVAELLRTKGFNLLQNPNEREIDLLIIEKGIEVKFDEYAKHSGNFYIEFECNGQPSGLYRPEDINLHYWCHTDGETVFLLNGRYFKRWVGEIIVDCRANKSNTSKGFRVVENGGDGGRTKGLLVPVEKLKEQADLIYKL